MNDEHQDLMGKVFQATAAAHDAVEAAHAALDAVVDVARHLDPRFRGVVGAADITVAPTPAEVRADLEQQLANHRAAHPELNTPLRLPPRRADIDEEAAR